MTIRLPLLAAIALLLSAAAPDPMPPRAPLRLVETISPQGLQQVSPGAIVSTSAIHKPDSVILAGDIVLDHKGEWRTFSRGTVIQAGGPTGVTGAPEAIFCEAIHGASIGKVLTGQLPFGVIGALRPTQLNARYCLFDADQDSKFDHAFLVGAKGAGAAPFAIPPVGYGVFKGKRLADDSVARLRYAGPAGTPDMIAFDLEAFAIGKLRKVPHARTFIPITKLPAYGIIGVAVVTVLKYDPETRVATIRMDHDLAPGQIDLPELARAY